MRIIVLFTALNFTVQSTFASGLVLVNKKTGEEIGPLRTGVEIELNGVAYVVRESTKSNEKMTSPKEALRTYFACKHWEDRIPLVVDQERVGKLMAAYYSKGFRGFQAPRYVKIGPNPKREPGDKKSYIYEVNVSGSDVAYVVQETEDGYKVNWEKSRKLWGRALAREEKQVDEFEAEQIKERFNLESAEFRVKITKLGDKYRGGAVLRIDVENRSKAFLADWRVEASLYDKEANYLGQTSATGKNLQPGKKMFSQFNFFDVKTADIDNWSLRLSNLTVEDSAGETQYGAEKYFTLEEVKK